MQLKAPCVFCLWQQQLNREIQRWEEDYEVSQLLQRMVL